ncbi:iron-sulfur cluster insertion protein ErpA [Buchnera aphidicola (Hormaphis cornu)]|nr:iron-sulfur cluster insertion protein ErpA [Buchnera aphidicola (Hormaphis cornu)]
MQKNKNSKSNFRIYITGGGCNGFQYGFILDPNINQDDFVMKKLGISIVIDPISLQYLIGGKIDFVENLEGSKFIVHNPNAKTTCGCGLSFSI